MLCFCGNSLHSAHLFLVRASSQSVFKDVNRVEHCLRLTKYCATVLSISTMTSNAPNKDAPVPLSDVDSWKVYVTKYNRLRDPEHAEHHIGEHFEYNSTLNEKVSIWQGSITSLQIDAIVNAANNKLLGGGGVDGAIHRAAGPDLLEECRALNGCDTGDAKITKGYNLPAKHVIHTVGPREEKKKLLESCYEKSLLLLEQENLRSIAFPCISTGIYGYPQAAAAKVAIVTARKFLEKNPDKVDRIIFCLFLQTDVEIYQDLMQQVFPTK